MPDLNDFKDKKGRFVKGNPGGPGSTFNQRQLAYRELFQKVITEPKFKKLLKVVYGKAMKGDMVACKLLFERMLGKIPEGASISVQNGTDGNPIIQIKVDDGKQD